MEVYAPGGRNSKHGHMNSAVFFVLKGKGHDVHDGRRYDWEAGEIKSLVFSPDGATAAAACEKAVVVWDVD